MFGLGIQELVIILLIVLVLFGAKKIPDLLRGLGEGLREFKAASREPVENTEQTKQLGGPRVVEEKQTPPETQESEAAQAEDTTSEN